MRRAAFLVAIAAGLPPTVHAQPVDTEPVEPLEVVYFASGSWDIAGDERGAIEGAVDWMRRHPDRLLVIEGHTDREGDREANELLSYRRASAVRDALVGAGADPLRLVTGAFGERAPARSPTRSRRVVLRGTVQTYRDLIMAQRPGTPPPLEASPAAPRRAPAEPGPSPTDAD